MSVLRLRTLRLMGMMGLGLNCHPRLLILLVPRGVVVDFPRVSMAHRQVVPLTVAMVSVVQRGMLSRVVMAMVCSYWRWMLIRRDLVVVLVAGTVLEITSSQHPMIEVQQGNRQ